MKELIMASLVSVTCLWLMFSRLKFRRHDVDDAARYVLKELGDMQKPAVRSFECYPLTEHQVKEVAKAQGYRFLQASVGSGGYRTLVFTRKAKRDV